MDPQQKRVTALRDAADAMHAARRESERARDIARTVALEAIAAGMSESSVARCLDVERLTVRRWSGKNLR